MELVHTLNGVVIDEPVGFDNLKTTIKRHEYHGMSVEVSVGDLEFYGNAVSIIESAYNADIDSVLEYEVKSETETIYKGKLDLSTYNEINGQYKSISCKVGEVGEKTAFNNRSDVSVDLNSDKTIDGNAIAHKPYWNDCLIPQKTFFYKSEFRQNKTDTYNKSPGTGSALTLPDDFCYAWLNLSLDTTIRNEASEATPVMHIGITESEGDADGFEPFYRGSVEDLDSIVNVDINVTFKLRFTSKLFINTGQFPNMNIYSDVRINGWQTVYIKNSSYTYRNSDYNQWKEFKIIGSLSLPKKDIATLHVGAVINNNNYIEGYVNDQAGVEIEIQKGSYVRISVDSKNNNDIYAPVIFVHEAVNNIVESISDNKITVKSDLYSRFDSLVNNMPGDHTYGNGALKAITNGYKIRGIKSNDGKERNMPISFKEIIESLDSIDCIGWCFEEEDGKLYVRIESWDWFYKNNKILDIINPNEITRQVDDRLPITELNIGYKKYTTADDLQSIDSVHGERTYVANTAAIAKSHSALCNFIADNYAIEETRRAAINKASDEEFKYDENVFIFSMCAKPDTPESSEYIIPYDIESLYDLSILRYEEMYNAIISPTRNALKWIKRLFCLNGMKVFKLAKGTVNYTASYSTKKDGIGEDGSTYIYGFDPFNMIPEKGVFIYDEENPESFQETQTSEDMDFTQRYYKRWEDHGDGLKPIESSEDLIINRVMKAEVISCKYPISIQQYKSILANPYGLVAVDGEECWIKEFQYDFNTSEAEFKLTPKAK